MGIINAGIRDCIASFSALSKLFVNQRRSFIVSVGFMQYLSTSNLDSFNATNRYFYLPHNDTLYTLIYSPLQSSVINY